VAVVSAREAAAGLPAVLNSAMRRLLNSPTAADDMPALLAWWRDEWQRAYGPAAAAGQQTPKTSSKARSRTAAAGDDESPDMDVDAAATTQWTASKAAAAAAAAATPATAARELRARPAPKTPGRVGGGSIAGAAAGGGAGGCASLGVPVLVLQEADGGDLEALEELVVALSEVRAVAVSIVWRLCLGKCT
jgi:hypothetical protein